MRFAPNIARLATKCRKQGNAVRIAALRKALEGLQGGPPAPLPAAVSSTQRAAHAFLGPGLPGPDLAAGVLHELAAGHADQPAAFGFLFTLMAAALAARPGPAVFIAARRAVADFGLPYGHGLAQLGLDSSRLILVETGKDKDALWALEEVLRSQARPAMVAGALEGGLDLTPSRRLNLAAAVHATPLAILRGARATGTSAAATRWRIASAPAARDRFGTFTHPRWRVALERCRNAGRPGEWLIEWNHAAYRFRVVEGLADRPPVAGEGFRLAG
jgi:protein ImuA